MSGDIFQMIASAVIALLIGGLLWDELPDMIAGMFN